MAVSKNIYQTRASDSHDENDINFNPQTKQRR